MYPGLDVGIFRTGSVLSASFSLLYRYISTHSDTGTAGTHGTLAEGEKYGGDKEETGAGAALRTLTYADAC